MKRRTKRRGIKRKHKRTRKQKGGASIIHIDEASKIRVFMCANNIKPTLEALMKSLEDNNFSYEVLGYRKPWENLRCKTEYYLKGSKAYAKEAGNDALAIYIDGFDCLCIQNSAEVYKKYMERPRKTSPIIFGAEEYCLGNCFKGVIDWYDVHGIPGGKAAVEARMAKHNGNANWTTAQPTFMNTGFIMGPAGEMVKFFEKILDTPYEIDDQYTTGKYVTEHLKEIDLDLEENLIRNKIVTLDKQPDEGALDGPAFLHFPGHRSDEQQAQLLERFKGYMTL